MWTVVPLSNSMLSSELKPLNALRQTATDSVIVMCMPLLNGIGWWGMGHAAVRFDYLLLG